MITITTEGIEDLLQGLNGMQRQIPYAVANGLNATARRVKGGLYVVMGLVFDRPTPYTLNSMQLTMARAPRGPLEAQVWFRTPSGAFGDENHYLLPQVEGGARQLKAFERGMSKKFLGSGGRYVVPSQYAPLDKYGNLGRGMITKLLSIAGGFHEMGFSMNAKSKTQREYFTLLTRRGKLAPGVYQRVVKADQSQRFLLARAIVKKGKVKGQLKELKDRTKETYARGIQPLVFFPSKSPSYTKRFDFYGIAENIVNQHYRSDMEAAIAAEIEREMAYRAGHGR